MLNWYRTFSFSILERKCKTRVEKNEDFFENGLPLIDAIAITFIKDKQTAFLEFIKGNLDFISGLDASYKDELLTPQGQLQENYIGKIQIQTLPYLNTEYLGFLMDENNLSASQHLAVRKAINYGFDRQKMITYLAITLEVLQMKVLCQKAYHHLQIVCEVTITIQKWQDNYC